MFWRVFLITALGVLNAILFYRMMWSPHGILAYHKLREEYSRLENRMQDIDRQNLALSQEILLLRGDDAYIEKMIRKRLHYVKENEIFYLFGDAQSSSQAGAGGDAGKN